MINVLSNIWYALLALLITTSILHLILVYPKNLSKKQWKRIDYLWISLTAIGLIGATSNVKIALSKGQLSFANDRIPFQYEYLCSLLSPGGSKTVCRDFVREEYSPSNFDSIVADYNDACEWSIKTYKLIALVDTSNYQLIDTTKIPVLETKHNKWFKNIILDNIRGYNKLIEERRDSQNEIVNNQKNDLLFFTPLLLIFGLAIRITKVSGELRHEK
jgi:hypothetical protein